MEEIAEDVKKADDYDCENTEPKCSRLFKILFASRSKLMEVFHIKSCEGPECSHYIFLDIGDDYLKL